MGWILPELVVEIFASYYGSYRDNPDKSHIAVWLARGRCPGLSWLLFKHNLFNFYSALSPFLSALAFSNQRSLGPKANVLCQLYLSVPWLKFFFILWNYVNIKNVLCGEKLQNMQLCLGSIHVKALHCVSIEFSRQVLLWYLPRT